MTHGSAWAGKSDRLNERVGELFLATVSEVIGFGSTGLSWRRPNNGPDLHAYNKQFDMWGIFEAKGGSSKLGRPLFLNGLGRQMDHKWIKQWYKDIAEQNQLDSNPLGPAFHAAWSTPRKPLLAIVASLDIKRKTRKPNSWNGIKHKEEFRIGFQGWKNAVGDWEKWKKRGKVVPVKHFGFQLYVEVKDATIQAARAHRA